MVINYHNISLKSPNLSNFFNLYEQSFPADERRETADLTRIIEHCNDFHITGAFDGDTFLGFFTHWQWNDHQLAYGEHFAIKPEARCGGIGRQVLEHVLAKVGFPVVIEVEPGTDPLKRRRIAFYERAGFKQWPDVPYVQPPYSPGRNSLPLVLMSHGNMAEGSLRLAAKLIHQRVYGVGQ